MYELLIMEHSVMEVVNAVSLGWEPWGFVQGLMDREVAQLAGCRSGLCVKEC